LLIERYDDARLADAVEQRSASLERWKKTYWDDFIPFAHGVRRLAVYYNDAVRPDDPYEFVGLLQQQPLLAAQRNLAIHDLAGRLARNPELRRSLEAILADHNGPLVWSSLRESLVRLSGGEEFAQEFEELSRRFLDITYEQTRLQEAPEPLLRNLLELSQVDRETGGSTARATHVEEFEERLSSAVGDDHLDEAREMISIGRLSWKLRDDDNLLVSRIESQLLRALEVAIQRLRSAGRVVGDARPGRKAAPAVVRALREPGSGPLEITEVLGSTAEASPSSTAEVPRQLVGQPASPGLATGTLRIVRDPRDLGAFRQGEILLCDAIQPTMMHLAMLAAAIIERRGGMLIHGAIIARELGIPCVNGIRDVTRLLRTGELVTVDGYLGIVTVGSAELDLELRTAG
jgi:pyruvate,water dikinase